MEESTNPQEDSHWITTESEDKCISNNDVKLLSAHQEWCTGLTAALSLLIDINSVYTSEGAETEGTHAAYLNLVRSASVYLRLHWWSFVRSSLLLRHFSGAVWWSTDTCFLH